MENFPEIDVITGTIQSKGLNDNLLSFAKSLFSNRLYAASLAYLFQEMGLRFLNLYFSSRNCNV
jgi:hypothetical protein